MEVKTVAKDTGISATKVRPLADLIRGKKVNEALSILQFASSPAARVVAKAVKSAAANAENNYELLPEELKVAKVFIDEARTMKRYRPRARGRASSIIKRSSHITVIIAG
jgi:large subunit ribosomal protein L22